MMGHLLGMRAVTMTETFKCNHTIKLQACFAAVARCRRRCKL